MSDGDKHATSDGADRMLAANASVERRISMAAGLVKDETRVAFAMVPGGGKRPEVLCL